MSALAEPAAATASRGNLFGVSVAMVTPFSADGTVDLRRVAAHATRVMSLGADGVTLFGTTGEGPSLGMEERRAMLEATLDAGIAPQTITVGIAAADLDTAEAQARLALSRGVSRLLLAPPFYFKSISEEGLFRWVGEFIDRLEGLSPQIILYHIPQVTGVRFDAPLVRRLKDTHGPLIFGLKDSEGDWSHTVDLLPMQDLAILIGDERLLARAAPLGGAGSISGLANLMPGRIAGLVHEGRADDALNALVDDIVAVPVTPMVKALVGAAFGEEGWQRTRSPLDPADPEIVAALAPRVVNLQS